VRGGGREQGEEDESKGEEDESKGRRTRARRRRTRARGRRGSAVVRVRLSLSSRKRNRPGSHHQHHHRISPNHLAHPPQHLESSRTSSPPARIIREGAQQAAHRCTSDVELPPALLRSDEQNVQHARDKPPAGEALACVFSKFALRALVLCVHGTLIAP